MMNYIIENEELKVYTQDYHTLLFTDQGAAEAVATALQEKYGGTFWVTPMTPHEHIGLTQILNNI
jgi:plasmid rolling circle replication initiator protein Rep